MVRVGTVTVLVAVIAPSIRASTGHEAGLAPNPRVCGERGWAATAEGRPSVLARATGSGYYVWHDRAGWHLGLKARSTQRLEGQVTSTASLRLVHVAPDVRGALTQQARRFTFRLAGTGSLMMVDFKSPCAGRLVFQLGQEKRQSTPAVGAPTGSGPVAAQPPVFLGARQQAPGRSFEVDRPLTTGIVGRILIGPTCPVVGPDCPPAQTGRGTIRIETAPSSRDGGEGKLVSTAESDASGNFAATLVPGHYRLVVVKTDSGPGQPTATVADVEAGVVTRVTLLLDTGIR